VFENHIAAVKGEFIFWSKIPACSKKAAVNGRFFFEKLAPNLEPVSISKGSSFGGDQLLINLEKKSLLARLLVHFWCHFHKGSQLKIFADTQHDASLSRSGQGTRATGM